MAVPEAGGTPGGVAARAGQGRAVHTLAGCGLASGQRPIAWPTHAMQTGGARSRARLPSAAAPAARLAAHPSTCTRDIRSHPLSYLQVPDTQLFEIEPFVASMKSVLKSGTHNPFKNPER